MSVLWRPAYVAVGSNLGRPVERVLEGFERMAKLPDTHLEVRSQLYLSEPLGPQDQPPFVNAAAGLLTRLTARELLGALLTLERDMGRTRKERWGPRVIDLDLVWMVGEPIDEPGLTVPHPAVSARNFVLYPLADISPLLKIPGHGRVTDLKARVGGAGLAVMEQTREFGE